MMLLVQPMRSWTLPHDLTAARVARDHVREWWGTGTHGVAADRLDDAMLMASELAVNAVRHGRAPVELTLNGFEGLLRISVRGTSPTGDPQVAAMDDLATSGRGLAIVASLAADWGWSRDGDEVTVWATV